jgi:Spy/CpxP family protein refolding chaperone
VKQSIKTLAVIFSIALNVAFVAGYAFRKLGDRPKFAYEELDLSKDQRKGFEQARDRFLRALDETGDKIIERHIELIDLIASNPESPQAMDRKFEEIRSLQQSMQQRVLEHLSEDKKILTLEQQAKFFAVLKSRIREQGAPGPPWLPAGARQRR